VDYKVYKNNIMKIAIADTEFSGLSEYLAGPSTMAFSYDEPTTAASVLSKQTKALPLLTFKAGCVEGVVYDANGVKAIADIPSREVLLSRLLGSLKSPISALARVLGEVAKGMGGAAVAAVAAVADVGSDEGAPAVDATPADEEATATEAAAADESVD
jgi:large subunit ribosomal protein L10